MIRDPSDGSVRETEQSAPWQLVNSLNSRATAALPQASGLPLESTKPERQAKLEKSRRELENYRKTGLWTTTTDASSSAIAGDPRVENDE